MNHQIFLLILALLWDILLGEPNTISHPVVITGKIIGKADALVSKGTKYFELLVGGILIILGISVFLGMFFIVKEFSGLLENFGHSWVLGRIAELFVSVFFLKSTFAIRSMNEHAKAVFICLKKGEILRARYETSKIVSRNTDNLDKPHLISATVESIAENFVDSVISPIIFFVFGGIEGAIIYRVVNTLDAMIGYKNERYMWRGFVAAKLDDVMNFIPARLSIFFILVSSALLKMGTKEALRTLKNFKNAADSPNSYIPMCLFAGALKVKLEKVGFYSIGDFELPTDEEKIKKAQKLMNLSSFIFLLSVVIALFIKVLIWERK